jgi:predicted dehydrogenase
MDRRGFLGAAAAFPQLLTASERLRVGLIGAGGRGRLLAAEFKELGAEVAAVCDVYEPHLQAGLKAASSGARAHRDYRRLLEDPSLEAVIVATPDHWHAQMVIDAVEAGKDVYVEKPLAHTIEEGFRIIEAVRRTRRVVQVGTQRRSFDLFQGAKRLADSGMLGPVRLVNSWWLNRVASLRTGKLEGELDWEQWLGPAPKRPFDPVRFFNWYWFWDYSGGLLIGQAAHVIDAIQWFMNSSDPVAVTCAAAAPGIPGAEAPETCTMAVEFPENYLAVFTLGYQAMRYHPFHDQLIQLHGAQGRLDVGREWYAMYPESKVLDLRPSLEMRNPGSFAGATRAHIRNFLDCIRTRQEPNATVEMGQATNIVLCMAMEALRTGRRIRWNPALRRMEP